MEFKELELKYDAGDISLTKFKRLTKRLTKSAFITKVLDCWSTDDYYTNKAKEFIRYRHGDQLVEMTVKRKTSKKNNQNRHEVNLKLKIEDDAGVHKFCELLGYDIDFSLKKRSFIVYIDGIVLVYYILYGHGRSEVGRFVEIEADEDHAWPSEAEAWHEVLYYEKLLKSIGISPRRRLKKSLFEMYSTKL